MINNFSIKYDYRFDPFLEVSNAVSITDEDKVVPSSSPFYIDLEEVPLKEIPSTITAYDVTDGVTLTEVTSTPGSNEFQVDWKYLTGKVRFNSAQSGNTIRFNYKGTGHSVAATFLNVLANWIGAGYTLTDAHDHDGQNSKKVTGTADNTITGAMIQQDAVTSEKIQDGTINATNMANSAITEAKVAASAVSQSKLKTSQGEVSHGGSSVAQYTLPGGEYGFYPQIKMANTGSYTYDASIIGEATFAGWTSYVTKIGLKSGGVPSYIYAQQRYITSSGKDHWIFLLVDKATKNIVSSWQAPDHPSYGSNADENEMTHPFGAFDGTKYEVVLVDNEILNELKKKITRKKSMLTLINEEYMVDETSSPEYEPREIIEIDEFGDMPGEVLGEFDTPDWARIKIKKDKFTLKKRIVETLPPIIKYKRLKRKGV